MREFARFTFLPLNSKGDPVEDLYALFPALGDRVVRHMLDLILTGVRVLADVIAKESHLSLAYDQSTEGIRKK